ncbi:hypothetical protein MBLNU459_g1300t1 [Dothideomycetes sp. NU459]
MADSDEDTYTVPLRDQRYFGAGIKRKRVQFVPSSGNVASGGLAKSDDPVSSASERYLSIVLNRAQPTPAPAPAPTSPAGQDSVASAVPGDAPRQHAESQPPPPPQTAPATTMTTTSADACPVCNLPLASSAAPTGHASSLAHQICLPHSHPPSALDRKRKGISMLRSHGWDPDGRVGLGASGEGILHPIKPKVKRDTVGLGAEREDDQRRARSRRKQPPPKAEKLDAGRIRKMELEGQERDQRLRDMFYGSDDVERYLGGG